MKKHSFLLTVLLFIIILGNAQFTSANLQASGLTCAMCTRAIDNALRQLPYVVDVKPDIKNSSFSIVFKKGMDADIDGMQKAVEDAGFSVSKLQLTGTFTYLSIKNDEHIEISGKEFHFLNVSNQVLNGERVLTVIDKKFLSPKEFKKYSSSTNMSCLQTGKSGDCCLKAGVAAGTRIFHVTI
jgi:copper chaperone CopZ